MNVMNTYSGRKFDPMKIAPEDVYLEDIAHALSLVCRGGGQIRWFYSVGQHSINCAHEALARGWSDRMALACLLHDASECYISDVIRPVKVHLQNYLEIELRTRSTPVLFFLPTIRKYLISCMILFPPMGQSNGACPCMTAKPP